MTAKIAGTKPHARHPLQAPLQAGPLQAGRRVAMSLRRIAMRHIAMSALLFAACASTTALADYSKAPAVREYVDELVAEHGFDRDWLLAVFAKASKNDDVIARISKPAEKALKWYEYRRIFIKDERIDGGVRFWRHHRAVIERAAAEFNVAAEIIVAIIGVETYYGRFLGTFPVLDSLATLAFDYPRRAAFFKGQLTEYLLLVREQGLDPSALTGSYAGAFGYGQFIPSSFRNFAVDFDGDGVRNIWSNETDAIGSVANYFARHGWRGDGPVALRVTLAKPEAEQLANSGLELKQTVGALRAGGVQGIDGLTATEKANLMRMDLADGAEYWLALHDFYVITRYNHSRMYALAVLQLGQLIRERFDAGT